MPHLGTLDVFVVEVRLSTYHLNVPTEMPYSKKVTSSILSPS